MLNIEKKNESVLVTLNFKVITFHESHKCLNVEETFIETAIFYSGSMFLELKGSYILHCF